MLLFDNKQWATDEAEKRNGFRDPSKVWYAEQVESGHYAVFWRYRKPTDVTNVNDLNEDDCLHVAHRPGVWTVLQILDGYRGIQVKHARHPDPIWIDLAEVKGKAA